MRPATLVALLSGVLALSGCGHSPATTFLAIDPAPPPATPANYRGPPVRVPFLHVPITLDRPEFVRHVAGTVAVSDFDRWAAPLGLLARNALIQDLQVRLPAGSVLPPDSGPNTPEVRVEATVLSFRAENGEAVMSVSYRVVQPRQAGSTAAQPAVRPVTLRTPLAAQTPVAVAQAWSLLLGQLADRVVAELDS